MNGLRRPSTWHEFKNNVYIRLPEWYRTAGPLATCVLFPTATMGQSSSHLPPNSSASTSACPIKHDTPSASPSGKCPVSHDAPAKPAQCPVDHGVINPQNQMPSLSQSPAPHQNTVLPMQREESSIPRNADSKWEYPSPQQFYNALVRKGWETPEEHIETMVQVHNFLNEEAWLEVLKWEKRQYKYGTTQTLQFLGLRFS